MHTTGQHLFHTQFHQQSEQRKTLRFCRHTLFIREDKRMVSCMFSREPSCIFAPAIAMNHIPYFHGSVYEHNATRGHPKNKFSIAVVLNSEV